MKNSTLVSLVNYLNSVSNLPADVAVARDDLNAEYSKKEEKAQANREAYADAHDTVMNVLSDKPLTVQEIFEACADELPEGFSRSKIQYAVRELWGKEVVKHDNGKNPYTYTKA